MYRNDVKCKLSIIVTRLEVTILPAYHCSTLPTMCCKKFWVFNTTIIHNENISPIILNNILSLALDQCPWVLWGRPSIGGSLLFTLCLHKDRRHLGSVGLIESSGLSGTAAQQFHFVLYFFGEGLISFGTTVLFDITHIWHSWGVLGGVGVGSAQEENEFSITVHE